ncbi:Hypothetical_protein [Hexamita inflata]|uniref:Hypothetical_protein n=1 Tax=Hexamita inflata TaxID=28002 RepID=A0AA86UH58_9EUKA|nr:Hypothetical protein HINF_LOCUS38597 [Hexamita inflata]
MQLVTTLEQYFQILLISDNILYFYRYIIEILQIQHIQKLGFKQCKSEHNNNDQCLLLIFNFVDSDSLEILFEHLILLSLKNTTNNLFANFLLFYQKFIFLYYFDFRLYINELLFYQIINISFWGVDKLNQIVKDQKYHIIIYPLNLYIRNSKQQINVQAYQSTPFASLVQADKTNVIKCKAGACAAFDGKTGFEEISQWLK